MNNTSNLEVILPFIISNIFIFFAMDKIAADFKISRFRLLTIIFIRIAQLLEVIKCIILIRSFFQL